MSTSLHLKHHSPSQRTISRVKALLGKSLAVAVGMIAVLSGPAIEVTSASADVMAPSVPSGPSCSFSWLAPAPTKLSQYAGSGLVAVPFHMTCHDLPDTITALHFDVKTGGGVVTASAGNGSTKLPTSFDERCEGSCLKPGSQTPKVPLFASVGSITANFGSGKSTSGALSFQDQHVWWKCDSTTGCGSVVVAGSLLPNPKMPSGGYAKAVAVSKAAAKASGTTTSIPSVTTPGSSNGSHSSNSNNLLLWILGALLALVVIVGVVLLSRKRSKKN